MCPSHFYISDVFTGNSIIFIISVEICGFLLYNVYIYKEKGNKT